MRHTIRRLDPRIKTAAASAHRQFLLYQKDIDPFWLLHGANMMASDYDEGIWSPLFEKIYDDEPTLLSMDQALDVAISKYWSVDGHGWLGDGRAVSAWLVLDDHKKFGYYLSGLAELVQAGDPQEAIRKPHNDIIWRMFTTLKQQVIAAVEEKTHGVDEDSPEGSPEVQ